MSEIEFVRLECKTGHHNKYYELTLIQSDTNPILYSVEGRYGAIGTNGIRRTVSASSSSLISARRAFEEKRLHELAKGYSTVPSRKTKADKDSAVQVKEKEEEPKEFFRYLDDD